MSPNMVRAMSTVYPSPIRASHHNATPARISNQCNSFSREGSRTLSSIVLPDDMARSRCSSNSACRTAHRRARRARPALPHRSLTSTTVISPILPGTPCRRPPTGSEVSSRHHNRRATPSFPDSHTTCGVTPCNIATVAAIASLNVA